MGPICFPLTTASLGAAMFTFFVAVPKCTGPKIFCKKPKVSHAALITGGQNDAKIDLCVLRLILKFQIWGRGGGVHFLLLPGSRVPRVASI